MVKVVMVAVVAVTDLLERGLVVAVVQLWH